MRLHSARHSCGFFRALFSVLNQRRELLIMTMQEDDYEINHHYGRGDLGTTILAALQAAGKNPQRLTPDDLAPVDQFHTAGKQATLELMHLAALQAGMEVLDVGGGLGGNTI
jgi:cyclopropane fatty-acyl-phospholipid synthase-like methyltransferase